MKRLLLSLTIIYALLPPAAGQQPSASPNPPQKQDKDDVVRITSNLVQVDATVTDKKGRPIGNLQPEDFEIFEDGRPQKITNFSFISRGEETPAPPAPAKSDRSARNVAAPPPPVVLRREDVRRTVALVVDDLGLSFESMHFVRAALRKFVDEQMQTGDLVAIIRTGAGVGALQQFTSDKRLLYAAIERVKWNSRGRSGIAAFSPLQDSPLVTGSMQPSENGPVAPKNGQDIERQMREQYNDFKDEIFSVGTLGAINYIVRGLRPMPGRKSVVLLSESMNLFDTKGDGNYRTIQALRRLTDLASRASVVIYSIDPRGLPPLNLSAADNTTTITTLENGAVVRANSGPALMQSLTERSNELWRSQEGLRYLALETGGFFFNNNNDLNLGIKKAIDDSKGYYLIGYRPDESTFDKNGQRRFHNVSVKVKQPDLIVRTRSGFFGISNEEATPVRRTTEEYLMAAITSPFASGEVDLRLTSIFLDEPPIGSFMRSFIYVSGHSLTFKEEPNGDQRATLDVLAMTFNDQGFAVDRRSRSQDIVVPRAQYQAALENGLIFGINLPIKTPGAFQLRIAVRDGGSGRVGSANQFIEVPDLKKDRLTLSGLYLAQRDPARSLVKVSTGSSESAAADKGVYDGDPQSGPAIRRFRAGATLEYGYEVYNTRLDKATRLQQLQSQVRLFRDNQLVFTGKVLALKGLLDQKRLVAFGQFPLNPSLPPGDYVLQVIVTDALAKEKNSVATQWIDFEIK